MREGFTTGSCAAAAAKAAAYMLLSGRTMDHIEITVPRGDVFRAEIADVTREEDRVKCAVKKDGGDDPDVTDGMLIYAEVGLHKVKDDCDESASLHKVEDDCDESASLHNIENDPSIYISGGEGIGRITRPGLDRKVGDWAINTVPRRMIESCIREVCALFDETGDMDVVISAPGGEKVAERTFNPRLGIEGGISIIGTSGVVEPMSTKAITDTIRLQLTQQKELGRRDMVVSPGNYGRTFLMERYGYDIDRAVKCSNFIGETIDMCVELEYERLLIAGHAGKLVKLSCGIMNTHSHEADGRMEAVAAAGIRCGVPEETLKAVLDSVTVEEALGHIKKLGPDTLNRVMSTIMKRISYYLDMRSEGRMGIQCMIYAEDPDIFAATDLKEAESIMHSMT